MVPLLLWFGIALEPVALPEKPLDVRVVDIDADGVEDVVAVGETKLFLFRGGRGPALVREAPPLTVVGRGLCGVVRDGRFRAVQDPFGDWKEGEPGPASLLAALGRTKPALLVSPGDLDGDGRDDPVLSGPAGFHAPGAVVPVVPTATLDILRNETFAVGFRIPVPTVGNWSGRGRELVFFHADQVLAFRGAERTDAIPLKLPTRGREAESIRRNQVFVRDIDNDGRLDLLVVVAKGATRLFATFEATARFFRGGRVYHHGKQGYYRPASFLKVAGALLKPELMDLDSDGDLDLVLCTVEMGPLAHARGSAEGTYHLFRFETRAYRRNPAWTFRGQVPTSAFSEKPQPPVRFLPDLDGDGRPEALSIGKEVRLLEADRMGRFRRVARHAATGVGRPAVGRTRAAVPHAGGLLLVETQG